MMGIIKYFKLKKNIKELVAHIVHILFKYVNKESCEEYDKEILSMLAEMNLKTNYETVVSAIKHQKQDALDDELKDMIFSVLEVSKYGYENEVAQLN